jgi:hypothetical protein
MGVGKRLDTAVLNAVDGPSSTAQGADPSRFAGTSAATAGTPKGTAPAKAPVGNGQTGATGDTLKLSPEALAQVAKLKARDAEVRAHEAAHLAAGGGVTRGGATFSYEHGPDGQSYAVGGEVGVDTSPVANNPQATIAKANIIRAAALAPADPSPQDQSVAAAAAVMAANAAAELAKASSGNGTSQGQGAGTAVGSGKIQMEGSAAGPASPQAKGKPGSLLDLSA